jgi:beta-galactosidase/beta-glucuronidase
VDYLASVYINGKLAGKHKGGYVSFSFDINEFVTEGENILTVHAEDDTRSPLIPTGKQCPRYFSSGCEYTRTTGIWQTVWLEYTPKHYIKNFKLYPDADACTVTVEAEVIGCEKLTAAASFEGKAMGEASVDCTGATASVTLQLSEKHLWELGQGRLYDLELRFGEDLVHTYFGLRTIRFENMRFYLNGKSVFQRTILDQGFYPDGIYTAPCDAELAADIDRSMIYGY